MLNIDWFNPYQDTQYSVGAIYLVVQNLPHSERFKVDNIILVGLIPGPREPKSVSTYLDLLVEDFRKLYRGVSLPCPSGSVKLRAVLSCIVCDCEGAWHRAAKRVVKVENIFLGSQAEAE